MTKTRPSFSKFVISDDRREASLSLLLVLQLLTIFIVAPLIDSSHGQHRWALDPLIALMAFVSAFIVKDKIRRRLAIFSFILCLIGFALGPLLVNQIISELIVSASEIIFSLNVCWIVAVQIFAGGPVTTHRIRGAVVLYLNIASPGANAKLMLHDWRGMLPSPARFRAEAAKAGLQVTEEFAFGQDYALTLRHWLGNFEARLKEVRDMGFDEKFIRMWRFYLTCCIAAFRHGRTDVMQWELRHAA